MIQENENAGVAQIAAPKIWFITGALRGLGRIRAEAALDIVLNNASLHWNSGVLLIRKVLNSNYITI